MANSVPALDGNTHAAFAKLIARHARRAQAKRPLAALKVGNTHSGEQHALKLFWRKRYGNANHRAENTRVAQPVPERRPLAHGLDFCFAEGDGILANLDVALRTLDFGR